MEIIWKGTRTLPCAGTGALKVYKVGTPTATFWQKWRAGQEALTDLGYIVEKVGDDFEVRKELKTVQKVTYVPIGNIPDHPKLKPSQQGHYKILLSSLLKNFAALDGSETGTGKTYVGCAIAEILRLPTFIICPKPVIHSWLKVASRYHINLIGVGNYEAFKQSNTPFGVMEKRFYAKHLIKDQDVLAYLNRFSKKRDLAQRLKTKFNTNHLDALIKFFHKWFGLYENWPEHFTNVYKKIPPFKKCLKARGFKWILPENCLVIWDEVHKCGSETSQNSKMLIASKPFKTLMLSATALESPDETKALGYIFGLHNLYDFREYISSLGSYKDDYGSWDILDDDNKEAMIQIHNSIYGVGKGSLMLRKDDPTFPESQIEAKAYNIDETETNKLNEFYAKLTKRITELREQGKEAEISLTERMKFRRMFELHRIPIMINEALEAMRAGFSVAIFTGFRETLFALSEKLRCDCLIYGEQKSKDRQEAIDSFQSNKSQLIISTVEAGGTGVELHDIDGKHPRYSIIAPIEKAKEMRQVFGRVHRSGGKSKSLQRLIFIAGTIEENIAENLDEKLKAMDAFNHGTISDKDLLFPILEK